MISSTGMRRCGRADLACRHTRKAEGRRWVPSHRDRGQGGRLLGPSRCRSEASRCGGDDTGDGRRSLVLADTDDPAEHDQERELRERRPARVGRTAVLGR